MNQSVQTLRIDKKSVKKTIKEDDDSNLGDLVNYKKEQSDKLVKISENTKHERKSQSIFFRCYLMF